MELYISGQPLTKFGIIEISEEHLYIISITSPKRVHQKSSKVEVKKRPRFVNV